MPSKIAAPLKISHEMFQASLALSDGFGVWVPGLDQGLGSSTHLVDYAAVRVQLEFQSLE